MNKNYSKKKNQRLSYSVPKLLFLSSRVYFGVACRQEKLDLFNNNATHFKTRESVIADDVIAASDKRCSDEVKNLRLLSSNRDGTR